MRHLSSGRIVESIRVWICVICFNWCNCFYHGYSFYCASLSAEDYVETLQSVVDAQNQISDKTARSFTELLNTSDYKDVKEKLLDLAKSGEITPETLSSTEDHNALLTKTGTSTEDTMNQILDCCLHKRSYLDFPKVLISLNQHMKNLRMMILVL